eukprot:CAMPEP_0171071200 /NCGR_PEP_ID=MMETSP0766_2-20121228/10191_1 /TAXON_ID=439317 /ORGANISM="Gambierdiscus australes, Strain CAWD 149" /LENGTH=39 /DNA_ID= /DNA_START= /DNA_END= /DNA_ORIENTATION=
MSGIVVASGSVVRSYSVRVEDGQTLDFWGYDLRASRTAR